MKNQLYYYIFNFLFLIFFLNSTNLKAQKTVPEWQWATAIGGDYSHNSQSMAIDNEGNTYITGQFNNTIKFGNIVLIATPSRTDAPDIYIAKLNRNGVCEWAVNAEGKAIEDGRGIAVDELGNVYVTGYFSSDTISFGKIKLTTNSGSDIFIAKLNTHGQWQWAVSPKGWGNDQAHGIAIDAIGDIYITGYFEGKIIFGDTILFSTLRSTY